MSDQVADPSAADAGDKPSAPAARTERRHRRTMLSTGFSDLAGKTCSVCGFEGFRWQTTCPEGHPLT
jgi:hypothetical protein